MSIIQEFKEFAVKGNMIDLAVGVIIGGAFGKIVDSLVKDIIMPLITVITGGGVDFSQILEHLPELFKNIFSSGVATGGIAALILNIVLPEHQHPEDQDQRNQD